MDIEDYLQQKRALEAKKEILESKERLKEESEKKKKELEREKRKIASGGSAAPDEDKAVRTGREDVAPTDMFRRIMIWNIFILLVVVVLFAALWFFPRYGADQIEQIVGKNNEVSGSAVIETKENQETNQPVQNTQQQSNVTNTTQQTYAGPDFSFYAEDPEIGMFDDDGKLAGENLVISSPYYKDALLHLDNKENNVIKCFIDREVMVDEDGDGDIELTDFDLDIFVYELDPNEKFKWGDSLPGAFSQGTYHGKGKISASYETRCYYCIDKFCDKYDKNGESVRNLKIKFRIDPSI